MRALSAPRHSPNWDLRRKLPDKYQKRRILLVAYTTILMSTVGLLFVPFWYFFAAEVIGVIGVMGAALRRRRLERRARVSIRPARFFRWLILAAAALALFGIVGNAVLHSPISWPVQAGYEAWLIASAIAGWFAASQFPWRRRPRQI